MPLQIRRVRVQSGIFYIGETMTTRLVEATPSAHGSQLLIKQLLLTPLSNAPEQEIVYADRSRYTYRTLNERIGRLASGLQGLGVTPGQTVAIIEWDTPRYLEAYFAVPMMGAVIQMVNVKLMPEQILYTLNHAQADVILINADFLPILEPLVEQLESVRTIILMSDEPTPPETKISFAAEYEALLASGDSVHEFPDFDENTCATTFYTTGTTGAPKGVYFSHRQLVLHTLSLAAAVGCAPQQGRLHRDDVYMPLTPMFHVHAWGLPYLSTMLGLKQVYPGAYYPDRLLRLIPQEKVTFSHCVPTVLHMLLTHPSSAGVDLSDWKLVIGGSALPQAMVLEAGRRGIDIFGGYGLSETCPVLTISHLDTAELALPQEEQAALRCKAGRTIPLVDLRVTDEGMNTLPHDGETAGDVLVRAPWLTQGYLKEDEASEALWQGGYLHTGDVGHIDTKGYLQITDRAKDVIKTSGEWISSLGMENVLLKHPAVKEVAVIAQKDERWGERPLALIVRADDYAEPVSEQVLRKHVSECAAESGLGRFAILVNVVFVESLPKTSVGKMDKREMRGKIAK